jgi:hypothetical protein
MAARHAQEKTPITLLSARKTLTVTDESATAAE